MKALSLPRTPRFDLSQILQSKTEFGLSSLFLGIAVWNSLVAAINVTVWPRVYDSVVLAYMTPKAQVLPIIIPLLIAALIGAPLRSYIRALGAMAMMAAVTAYCWSASSEQWLNSFGYSFMS